MQIKSIETIELALNDMVKSIILQHHSESDYNIYVHIDPCAISCYSAPILGIIIISKTMVQNFDVEEIFAILAHETAHFFQPRGLSAQDRELWCDKQSLKYGANAEVAMSALYKHYFQLGYKSPPEDCSSSHSHPGFTKRCENVGLNRKQIVKIKQNRATIWRTTMSLFTFYRICFLVYLIIILSLLAVTSHAGISAAPTTSRGELSSSGVLPTTEEYQHGVKPNSNRFQCTDKKDKLCTEFDIK